MPANETSTPRGERNLDHFLASNPNHSSALAWKFLATHYRMREARSKSDHTSYNTLLAQSHTLRDKAIAANPRDVAVYIIVGGGMIMGAWYAPEEHKQALYKDGRELLRKVPVMQGEAFDKLPPHMRGETWSLLAYASDRLGDKADRDALIETMLTKLQGPLTNPERNAGKPYPPSPANPTTCASPAMIPAASRTSRPALPPRNNQNLPFPYRSLTSVSAPRC